MRKIKDIFDQSIIEKKLLFDLPFRIALIGRSGSGKTNVLINLLDKEMYGKDFKKDDIYIITGSLSTDDKIKNYVKKRNIPLENLYNGYKEDEMSELYNILSTNYKISISENSKPAHSLVIFDDISFSGALNDTRNGIMDKFACNSRKFLVSMISTAQKYTQLSTCIRENLTGLICASCSDRQLDIISEDFNYSGCKKTFRMMFRDLTNNKFTFFICNLSNKKKDIYMDSNFEPICICKGEKSCKNKIINC